MCKYGFPFKVPQLIEELDEDGIRYLYTRRCKEDQLVVPYNLEILLFWAVSINIQRVAKHRFEMYLAKYISKPESSFDVKLSENPTEPEKYLRTRIIGTCEAIDVQLGFHQFQLSRSTVFLATELNPQRQFLKHRVHLASLPPESEDIYVSTKYQLYLQRNSTLHNVTYPTYFQWWRKSNYSEQLKAEKSVGKGLIPAVGYKGVDEFEELKASIVNLESKFERLSNELKSKSHLWIAVQSIISASVELDNTAVVIKQNLKSICNDIELEGKSNEMDFAESYAILRDIGLFNSSTNRPEKLHWLHTKLLQTHNNNEIPSTPMYIMLENHPPGSMVPDQNGT